MWLNNLNNVDHGNVLECQIEQVSNVCFAMKQIKY